MTDEIADMEYIIKQMTESEVPDYWAMFLKRLYNCLLKVGFTEKQAMDILLSGVMLKFGKYER